MLPHDRETSLALTFKVRY